MSADPGAQSPAPDSSATRAGLVWEHSVRNPVGFSLGPRVSHAYRGENGLHVLACRQELALWPGPYDGRPYPPEAPLCPECAEATGLLKKLARP